MKHHGILYLVLWLAMACQNTTQNYDSALDLIPSSASVVYKINDLPEVLKTNNNGPVLHHIYNSDLSIAKPVLKQLSPNGPLILALTREADSLKRFLIITESHENLSVFDSIPKTYSDLNSNSGINKLHIDSLTYYQATIGKFFVATNDVAYLEPDQTLIKDENLIRLMGTTNDNAVLSIAFKNKAVNYRKLLFQKKNLEVWNNGFTVLDFNYSENRLRYNGIVKGSDSISAFVDCFKGTQPQKNHSLDITPEDTRSLLSITFDDFNVFDANRTLLDAETKNDKPSSFLKYTNEIAVTEEALILYSLDPELIMEAIEDTNIVETFREINLYTFSDSSYFEKRLKPMISFKNVQYFMRYENFIVFSDDREALKTIISKAQTNQTLAKTEAYVNINRVLSNEASMLLFKNADQLSDLLAGDLQGYDANAVQYIYEDNYAHINGVIEKFKKRKSSNSITQGFETTINADIVMAPQMVRNHITKGSDIAVQDVNNQLYLISSTGKVLWKKQLQGKILGEIKQIDMYKNGRLQLAFVTSNRLYVLDRNGKEVNPFPLKFQDDITQPLSVFDYDNRKNYRLLITQGRHLIMYDRKGKRVRGFDYAATSSSISSQPKHFRIASKDYIAFTTGESLRILNRRGKTRVQINEKLKFSGNPLFLYKNKFTTTNTLGQLVQADTRGRISKKNLNLPKDHKLETTSKTLVTMTENQLHIKSRTVELDYGDYSKPRIFYLNDKIYVSTTDRQSKKVYLFDSQAKSIPGFPVYGTAAAFLGQLDNERGLELITQGDSKTILAYKIN